jgi:hypothetical protein
VISGRENEENSFTRKQAKELRCTHRIGHLVTSGIYARTRNPVYLAFILLILGVAFLSRRLLAFLWVAVSVAAEDNHENSEIGQSNSIIE